MTHEFFPNVPIEAGEGHRAVVVEYRQVAGRGKHTSGGGGRESNPPATRHAAHWF
jgi:hypothetical protein